MLNTRISLECTLKTYVTRQNTTGLNVLTKERKISTDTISEDVFEIVGSRNIFQDTICLRNFIMK